MNLPIPTHLQEILIPIGDQNSEFEVTGKIKCSCCSEEFEVFESNERHIVKIKCKHCGREYLLLDAGKHGWDGFICKNDFLNRDIPLNKFTCPDCKNDTFGIEVYISSQGKKDFQEECLSHDDSFTLEDWVDAFEWITISLDCKKCESMDKEWVDLETM